MHFVYLYWVFLRFNPNRNVSIVYCVFCLPIDLLFYVLPLFRFDVTDKYDHDGQLFHRQSWETCEMGWSV